MSGDLIPTDAGTLPAVDPIALASDLSIVIAFPKSKSTNLPLVLAIAQGAEVFGIWDVPGRPMYVAGFARTPQAAIRAAALLDVAVGWVGVMCFANGRKIGDIYKVIEILRCYQQSTMCSDHRAHCHVIIDDPSEPRIATYGQNVSYCRLTFSREINGDIIERMVLPCKLMSSRIDFQAGHPSNISDRIQAVSVEHGCAICPNFDPGAYQSAGYFVRTLV